MNEKVDVEIGKRRLNVGIEGLTPLEIGALAKVVNDKIDEMARQNTNVVDTSKLALLAALDLAAELSRLQESSDTARRVLDNKIELMTEKLRESLNAAAPR